MIACVDVDYRDDEAVAACVLFRAWTDERSADEKIERLNKVEPYQPGQFYKRELPCLLAVLNQVIEPLDAIIVDGYVWLNDRGTPGLGAHLYRALQEKIPVIGVAKTRFAGASSAVEVKRGSSESPLYVTAVGIEIETVARNIKAMHGEFRIPTLLKRVDRLCRDA